VRIDPDGTVHTVKKKDKTLEKAAKKQGKKQGKKQSKDAGGSTKAKGVLAA
jgi:hypothetical protein